MKRLAESGWRAPRAARVLARGIVVAAAILASLTVAAATAAAAVPAPGASGAWPQRVRLVAAGTVAYPGRQALTVEVKLDVVFVLAPAPDPSIPGAWYVPAPRSVVRQSMSSAPDQWCRIIPRPGVVPIDPEQSFLHLDLRSSGAAVLVGSIVSAVRQPEVTIGIASCNKSTMSHSTLVFQTLSTMGSVIGEDGTVAALVAGAPFPTVRANSRVRMDSSEPTVTMEWTLAPEGK